MRRFVIITICFAALLTGCEQMASKIDVVESRRELTGVIERGHSELSAQHIKMMENDIEGLREEVAKSRANAAEAINKANEASQKAIAEEQARLRELQSLREYVRIFVPEQAANVIELTTKGIDTKINTLDALTQEIRGNVIATTERVNSAESMLANVDSSIDEVNRNLNAADKRATTAEVIAVRNEKFTGEVADDLGNRTRDGIIGLLTATGLATGGGTALAHRTGKSRASETLKLFDERIRSVEKGYRNKQGSGEGTGGNT